MKPILFNTDMVQAILDGRKTVTRRKVKNPAKPPCIAGDILYVRETWQHLSELDGNEQIIEGTEKYYYAATDTIPFDTYVDSWGVAHCKTPWRPSIHMPKSAARIWLRVTDVRVERLRDITPDEAIKEGIHFCECPDGFTWKGETSMRNCYTTPTGAMQALWDTTIKKPDLDCYGWDANPWVWVIKFERCEKPEEV
ncbi:ASCH domain-containing protein [Blautia sp. OF01-4LB]|nr:ASCH domain-containing protein [Blautia sp. OF01-4LB]